MQNNDQFDDDPTDIAALEEAAVDRDKADLRRKDTIKKDLAWLMSGMRGRRIVWHLINASGAFESSFNTNAMQMAHTEGRKWSGQQFNAWARNNHPAEYVLMIQEASK